jgi:hypothetical protein
VLFYAIGSSEKLNKAPLTAVQLVASGAFLIGKIIVLVCAVEKRFFYYYFLLLLLF